MILLLPAMAILALVSSQTGFSVHSRYALPVLPFIFVWIAKLGRCVSLRHWGIIGVSGAALCWMVGSSLWYYPHSLSYFNEIVGGPKNGHNYLLDSNIGWGQDIFILKNWTEEHREASPLHLASFGWVNPRLLGIDFRLPPLGPDALGTKSISGNDSLGPRPGWYAIEVNYLHSVIDDVMDGEGVMRRVTSEAMNYRYFLKFKPVAMAGYSIYIYHIKLDDANRVRRELGLEELGKGERNDEARMTNDEV
jgi:hypothetical protein